MTGRHDLADTELTTALRGNYVFDVPRAGFTRGDGEEVGFFLKPPRPEIMCIGRTRLIFNANSLRVAGPNDDVGKIV